MNLSVNKDYDQSIVKNEEWSKKTKAETQIVKDKEPNKYETLKIFCGLISFLGYVVMFIGLCLFIFFMGRDEYLLGVIWLIGCPVIAIPLLAFTNLIHVFIDIEYNTRILLKR